MEELTTIYKRMRETFAGRAGFTPNDGCDAMVRLYALSAEIQSLLAQADWVLEQCFPQTASGQYLDYHAESRGIGRSAATHAEGTLRFYANTAASADYEIPQGTVCMTTSGVKFETTAAATLSQGTTLVEAAARAVEAGASGNAVAGTVTVFSALPAGIVGCTNPAAFAGGSDEEDDHSLRERILESYRRLPNGANAAYYEQEAMGFVGVAAAKAVGRARGIGTVDVYVATHSGAPSDELLSEIAAALEAKREIAVDLRVLAPAEKAVSVRAELSAGDGYGFDEVCREVEAALNAYFTGALLGEPVLTAKLVALIYGVEGVANCHLLAPSADVAITATELPVLDAVTLTEIE